MTNDFCGWAQLEGPDGTPEWQLHWEGCLEAWQRPNGRIVDYKGTWNGKDHV